MEKKQKQCAQFYAEKTRLYQAIASCRTGNVVTVEDFFRSGAKYYTVMQQISPCGISIEELAALDPEKKMVLIRALLFSFAALHRRSVIHADIKPDNILIKQTLPGYYTGKIIDFDSAFFEDSVPEEIQGDQIYLAPEVRLHMMGEDAAITTKADIFALGILFHQYWSGKLPEIPPDYEYIFEAVLDGSPLRLDGSIPPLLRKLIAKMLDRDPQARPSALQILRILNGAVPRDRPSGQRAVSDKTEKGEKGFRRPHDLE